ncbi:SctD/MshK family protein [Bradyrhizobium sp. USDA 10063]
MTDVASLHYEVLSGLYSGLSGKVGFETTLIGSGLDADMVFVEQELEPHHFRIMLVNDSIEIEALASGIRIDGERNIAVGDRVVVSLPAIIHAGAISIRWSLQDATGVGSIGASRVSISTFAVLSLLAFLGVGTLSTIFFYSATVGAPSPDSPPAIKPISRLTMQRPDNRTSRAAAEVLQEEVDRAGLLNIKVGSGLGVVTAEGTITSALVKRWQEVQQWFDHYTNGTLTLVNGVIVKEEKGPSSIAVQAVWRGNEPYLLIGGQKYFVGALLNDGWTLDRIEERRVLLSRNGRAAAVSY